MGASRFDVLVAGEINPDLILSGEVVPEFGQAEQLVQDARLEPGSSSVIFACGAARLGLQVCFVGVCGGDVFGHFMLEAMRARGVSVDHVRVASEERTGVSVILNRVRDRAILTFPGAIGALRADEIRDDLLRAARHLHVSSYFLQAGLRPGVADLFARARSLGLTTSLDTNWDPANAWRGVPEVLAQTTVFLPNAAEACAIAGTSDAREAAAGLARQVETVGVKLGAEGSLGAQGGCLVKVPSIPVEPVDTIGAGDSFDAGFVYGFLQRWDLETCLRLGVVCGALSTQAAGGTAGQPTLDEALGSLRAE
jgi:sugar/nucleoside kinase (ribokinase family)